MEEVLGDIVIIGVIVALSFIFYADATDQIPIIVKDILRNLRKIKKKQKKRNLLRQQRLNKKKMCEKAIVSGVCPHECDICAWNTLD